MPEAAVLRSDDPRVGELLAAGWAVVAESWGARLRLRGHEDELSVYDPSTDKWTNLAPLLEKKSHFEGGVHVINGRILVMGGRLDNDVISNHVDVYDPATNKWTQFGTMSERRRGGASAFYNGKLYYFSGKAIQNGNKVDTNTSIVASIKNLWT